MITEDRLNPATVRRYFENARAKVDVYLGRGKGYRAFKYRLGRYWFDPPGELKYALICPPKLINQSVD